MSYITATVIIDDKVIPAYFKQLMDGVTLFPATFTQEGVGKLSVEMPGGVTGSIMSIMSGWVG